MKVKYPPDEFGNAFQQRAYRRLLELRRVDHVIKHPDSGVDPWALERTQEERRRMKELFSDASTDR